MRMKLALLAFIAAIFSAPMVSAQQAVVLQGGCGSITYDSGNPKPLTQDPNGRLCTPNGSGGDASAANQTAVQAVAGSDASKAQAVQGITGGKPVAVSATALPLPANAAQETGGNLATLATNSALAATAAKQDTTNTNIGPPGATVCATDTGSCSLNAQVQRALQRLTTLITNVGSPLQAGGTVGQGAAASVTAGWPMINGEPADATGTFTNGTQTGNVTTAGIDGYGTALITMTGTYGTATGTFLASDDNGTTFYPIACSRTDGTTSPEIGYTGLSNVTRAWLCPVQGFDSIRVLSSAVASGTVNVRISQSAAPTSAMTQQAVVGPGASGALNVTPDNVVDGTTTTASVTSATSVLTFTTAQLQGMQCLVFGFTNVGAGNTVVVDQAADGSTFNAPVIFWRTDINTASGGTTLASQSPTTAMQFVAPITAQGMRIRISIYSSGTVTAYGTLKRATCPMPGTLTASGGPLQVSGGSVAINGTPNNPILDGCLAETTVTNVSTTKVAATKCRLNGATVVSGQWGTLTDGSTTITAGGTSQQVFAANTSRAYLICQNLDPTEDLWLNFTSAAAILTAGSIDIKAGGGAYVMENNFVSTEAINLNATTTGHKFTCKQF